MDANPTLDQLQVFLAVVEAGSFSAAARRLNRAQSVVSYSIANLEAQLGLSLFERRGTRQPRLTEAGRAVLGDARRVVTGVDLLRARSRSLGQGLEGEVAVAVDALLPVPVVTAVMNGFRAAFPSVDVRLSTGALGVVADRVLKREAALGIAGESGVTHAELVGTRIGGHRMIPVAAPDHPLSQAGTPVPAAVVREHFQVVITDPSERTRGREFRVHAANTWRVTDAGTKHALILAGLGWGGLPAWMIEPDVAAGRLVALDLDPYPPTDYGLYAMRASDTPHGPAAAWLVACFERELQAFEAACDRRIPLVPAIRGSGSAPGD